MTRPALGKGLSALISEETVASVATEREATKESGPLLLPLSQIKPNPNQPRKKFSEESIAELAASIKERGVLQAILVAAVSDGSYLIVAGERRWRAAQKAGLKEIPAIVKEASEPEQFQMALIENIQREDLNPVEQAQGYQRLQNEFNMTQEKIAQVIGKDRAVIANTLRLLNLPDEMRQALVDGKISAGHGRALAALDDPAARDALYRRTISENLPVRAVEQAVRVHKQPSAREHVRTAGYEPKPKSPEARAIEEELQRALGRKVEMQIARSPSLKGWIRLEFYSLDDFDRLIAQLKKAAS
jgi:ParB family transcriptional regulator, chromosome partitioning protein